MITVELRARGQSSLFVFPPQTILVSVKSPTKIACSSQMLSPLQWTLIYSSSSLERWCKYRGLRIKGTSEPTYFNHSLCMNYLESTTLWLGSPLPECLQRQGGGSAPTVWSFWSYLLLQHNPAHLDSYTVNGKPDKQINQNQIVKWRHEQDWVRVQEKACHPPKFSGGLG